MKIGLQVEPLFESIVSTVIFLIGTVFFAVILFIGIKDNPSGALIFLSILILLADSACFITISILCWRFWRVENETLYFYSMFKKTKIVKLCEVIKINNVEMVSINPSIHYSCGYEIVGSICSIKLFKTTISDKLVSYLKDNYGVDCSIDKSATNNNN